MAIHKMTDRAIASKVKPGLYGDGGNLFLRVADGGTKGWVFRYTLSGGRKRAMGLGPYPDITLAEARDRAQELRRQRLDGEDPMAEKRAAKAKRMQAMTFRECADAYIKAHAAGWRDEREAKLWAASLRDHVHPVLGDLPVDAIDLPLVLRVIEPMWQTKTTTASRLRRRIEAILDWATVRRYRQGENPARWKGLLDQVLPKERKVARVEHHEALPYTETPTFVAELRRQDTITARPLEFAILTATRVGEVVGARWSEVDLQGRVWVIPPER
jgi:integrase